MKRRGRKPGQPQVMQMSDVRAYVDILMDRHNYTAQAACEAVWDQFGAVVTQSMVTRWRKRLRYLTDIAKDTRESEQEEVSS